MNELVTTRPRTEPIQTTLRRWLPPVALVSAVLMAGSPLRAEDSAWQWQGDIDSKGETSGGLAQVGAEQNFRGTVAAEGQASIVTSPSAAKGGLEAAIFAAANLLTFAGSSGSTVLTVHQLRDDGTDPAQSTTGESGPSEPSTRATLSRPPPGEEGNPDAIRLDVQAIHNYLSIDLTSDDPSYVFISSVDQESSGGVSAIAGGDGGLDGAASSGQTSHIDVSGASGGAGQASGGMRAVAIGNYTSMRYESGDGADGR